MDSLLIIASFVTFGLLIFLLLKKYNPVFSLMAIGALSILIMQFVNGTSILGEAESGSFVLDTFIYMRGLFISQFINVGINIMMVMGYVHYMNHLKANYLFAVFLGSAVKRFRSKFVILSVTLVIGILIKWVIPSAVTTFLLMFATVYPVLRALGISKITAISALTVTTTFPLGPNQFFTGWMHGAFTGVDFAAPDFFLQQEIFYMIPTTIITIITFIFATKFFEKREKAQRIAEDEITAKVNEIDPATYGLPTAF